MKNILVLFFSLFLFSNLFAEKLLYKGKVESITEQNQFRLINGVLSTKKIYGDYRSLALNEELIPNLEDLIKDIEVGDDINANWNTSGPTLNMVINKPNNGKLIIKLIDGQISKSYEK